MQTVSASHTASCVALFAEFVSYDVEGQTVRVVHVRSDTSDFATADAIRNRLTEIGVALLDSKNGTSWEKK